MSGGELMAVQAVASLGSKLLGGGGGAQAAPAAAAPGPFDAIMTGQPGGGEQAPPMPGRNSLFSGAQLTPDKAPMPTRNPLFSGSIDGGSSANGSSSRGAAMMPGAGVPLPGRNSLFHDEPGGMAETARGMFSPQPGVMEELADPALPPYSEHGKTAMSAQREALSPAKPIDNNQRARDQGWDVETIYGTELQSGGNGAPYGDLSGTPKSRSGVTEMAKPSPAKLVPPFETSTEEPVQAATTQAAPRLDEPAFDMSAPSAPAAKKATGGLFGITIPGVGELNEKLRGSAQNPLFQIGMGLLSSGYDGSNPFTQMNAGMGRIPGLDIAGNQDRRAQSKADEDAAEAEELRQIMAALAGTAKTGRASDDAGGGSRVAKQAAKVVR